MAGDGGEKQKRWLQFIQMIHGSAELDRFASLVIQ